MLVMFTNEYKLIFNMPYFSYIYFTITIKLALHCVLIEIYNTFRKECKFWYLYVMWDKNMFIFHSKCVICSLLIMI